MKTPGFADGASLDNSCSGSHEKDRSRQKFEKDWRGCLMMAAGVVAVEAVISLFRSRSTELK